MDIRFVNLMDIEVRLETQDHERIIIPATLPYSKLPKVSNDIIRMDIVGGVPWEIRHKNPVIKNLPAPEPGTIYLVSGMISEVAERDDVLTPSETKAVFDGKRLLAYRSLVRYTRTRGR